MRALISSIRDVSISNHSSPLKDVSFHLQKESVANDSFDLFNGLYVHNRFARQQVEKFFHFHHMLFIAKTQGIKTSYDIFGTAEEL